MADSDDPAPTDDGSLLRGLARSIVRQTEPAAAIPAGTVIADRFEIVREIGRGGFGRVFAARDRMLSRDVAVKLLARRDEAQLELFRREARATARLNHPNIVTAYDVGEWNGTPYLVLELLEGTTLAAQLAHGRVGQARAWQIIRDVTRAAAYAHSRGVLHLDLKSQNVFVLDDGGIKVLDFGLAGLDWDERQRIPGGTPATMAPEQKRGETTDVRTDVWAIGVILHELLYGKLPVPGAPLPAGISRRAARVLRRTLAVDPADRFPDAAALLALLEQRPRRLAWIAATVVLGGIAAAAWMLRPGPGGHHTWRHRQLTFRGDVDSAELSPDGHQLAFITQKRSELWLQDIGSDQPARVFVGDEVQNPRWFPDNQRVIVWTAQAHRIIARDRAPQPFARTEDVVVPMPDGQTVAVLGEAVPDGVTPVIQIDSLAGTTLRSLPLPASQFRFVMDLDVDTNGRMIVSTLDENRMRVFTVGPGEPAKHAWSEDADWRRSARWIPEGIVYTSGWPNVTMRMRTRDGNVEELTPGLSLGHHISASRDGTRILYHRRLAWNNLEVVSPTGARRPLTRGTTRMWGASVSRGRVAYVQEMDRQWTIVIADLASGEPRTRVRCPRWCAVPTWSRDGQRLAFVEETPAGVRLAVIAADGSGHLALLQTRPARVGSLHRIDWLSDHEVIYIADQLQSVHVVDLENGRDGIALPQIDHGWVHSVHVSPDARRIAFYWNQGRHEMRYRGTYIAEPRGGEPQQVVDGFRHPVGWDGDSVLVARSDALGEGYTAVTRVQLSDLSTSEVWASDLPVEHVAAFGTELLVMSHQETSDAWLMER